MGKHIWQLAIVAIILGLAPQSSIAQPANSQAIAAAQSLVDEAGDLMDAKKFALACPKLEQATKLVPQGIGSRLALAECYVGLGRLASAQGQYLQAEALARAAKDSRAKEAAAEAAKLKPKLATITLAVPSEMQTVEGLALTWDGIVWESAIWGTPIPVDVGTHVLELKAPGWKTWSTEVNIEANGRASKQDVPKLEKAPIETPKPLPATQPVAAQPTRTWLYPVGIGLATVGVGLGVGFTIGASTKDEEAFALAEKLRFERATNELLCPPETTDPRCSELTTLQTQRNTFSNVAIAGFVVGGVAAVGVVVLALITPSKPAATQPPKRTVMVLPSARGIFVTGTF
jgi:tetratricopeptide (TPR) repeat protein